MNKSNKCSKTQKNRIVVHKEDKEKRVYIEELYQLEKDGWILGISDSHKLKLSDGHAGKRPWNKNVSCDDKTKEKISSSLKGNIPWNKGLNSSNKRVQLGAEKSKQTMIQKYGKCFPNNNMTVEHKTKISIALKGKKKPFKNAETIKIKLSKEYLTKKKNNSFNTSSTEEELYKMLLQENKTKTIYRNYKDKIRYPYYCDFYIKEDDLFIELNAHWSHGTRPYDKNDEFCQKQLADWKEKSKTSKFYENAIHTWTVRDVEKKQCAEKNRLNYKVIY